MRQSSIGLVGAVLILGIAGALNISWLSRYPDIAFPVLLILIGFTGLVPLIIIWRRPGWDLFEPILVSSLFVFPNVIALYNKYYLTEPSFHYGEIVGFQYGEGMTIVAGFNFILLSFILVGYYVQLDWYDSVPTGLVPSSDEKIIKITRAFAALYMFIGVASYVVILFATPLHTNPFYLYQNTVPRSQIFSDVNFLVQFSQYMYIGLFLWMATTVAKKRVPSIVQILLLFSITGALLLLGGRGRTIKILVIVSVFMYYVIIRRVVETNPRYIKLKKDKIHQLLKEIAIPAFGFILILTVLILGILRAQRAGGVQNALYSINLMRILTLGNTDGRNFEYLLILIERVPNTFGYYYGTSYFRAILNFIPRALWAEKPPLTIGSTLRRVVFPEASGGRPPGVAGVFYANFGAPGVVIGGLASGILLRSGYELFKEYATSPIVVLLYSIFIVEFVVIGAFNNGAIFSFLWHVAPVIPVLAIHKWLSRSENQQRS